jgi:hypothetical protein
MPCMVRMDIENIDMHIELPACSSNFTCLIGLILGDLQG